MRKGPEVPVLSGFGRLDAREVRERAGKAKWPPKSGLQVAGPGVLEVGTAVTLGVGCAGRMHRSREDTKGAEQLGELAVGDGLALKVGRPRPLRIRTQRRDKGLSRQLRRLANVEHLLGIPQ